MQRIFFWLLPPLALLPPSAGAAFPQDAATSRELHALCTGRGFQTDYQGLSPSQSDIYPRNIIVTIPPAEAAPGTEAASRPRLECVFLTFPQGEIAGRRDDFLSFADSLTLSGLPFTVKILLAANEGGPPLPPPGEGFEHPTGIRVFAEGLNGGEGSCAIVSRTGLRNQISSGGGGTVAPIWLVKSLREACEETGSSVWLPNSASFLYRLGFIREDESLAPFAEESIPAAGLYLNDGELPYGTLLAAFRKLSEANTNSRDCHYSFVSLFSLEFWVDETFFLLCYIVAAAAVLLRTCFSTVGISDRNRAIAKDLGKSWYLILVLLAFTAGTLQLSQRLPAMNGRFAVAVLGQRIATVIAATLLFFLVLPRLSGSFSFESISRIMLLMAACNIFIFCSLDISFLFLFMAEYLACALARRARGKLAITASLVIMFVPFIPHAVNIMLSANPRALTRISSPGVAGSTLTALILFPFQLQFLRLLMQMEFFSRRKKSFILFRILSASLFVVASVLLFAFFYFLVIRTILFASLPRQDGEQAARIRQPETTFKEAPDRDYIWASYSTDTFMEYKFTNLTVAQAEGVRVLRYEISLETESGIPLNDCNYGYDLSGRHKAYLSIPDNPASNLDIAFTCGREVVPVAIITSYLQDADGTRIIERDVLNMQAGRPE